jgi:hypothetical protein
MKPTTRILFLSAFVSILLLFWLIPRINKASEVEYKRPLKNRETIKLSKKPLNDSLGRRQDKKVNMQESKQANQEQTKKYRSKKKIYKKEISQSELKIRPKMYGRGMQFYEEEFPIDNANLTPVDTIASKEL